MDDHQKNYGMKKGVISILFLGSIINFSAQEKEKNISEVIVQGKFLALPLKKVNENVTVISKKEIQNYEKWKNQD